ncbi:hypothetical protein SAY86_028666 [Trapa natans]|uniref:COBRA C-terminal domain-containing protein n=1 Tax=Trapa natans TaxID=22666 RepID=A0AAN7RCE7_TRANT|nr:hypothetical protein SAY86_028666 [Trapa natans]
MMGDSHCFDGTVSAAEFHIAASSFVERWNNRECSALPPWLWVSPLKQPWVHDQVERYLALEKLRLPWSCKEDDSTCCIASERSICAPATDDDDGDGDYLIVDDATLVESSDLETHHYYDFHIVYSFSYRVPLLYFRVYGADGQPLALSEFERDLPVGSADELLKSKWTFITQEMTVYKMPPDMNRTALSPPQGLYIIMETATLFTISISGYFLLVSFTGYALYTAFGQPSQQLRDPFVSGVLDLTDKCSAPIRVENTQFPDPSGLQDVSTAIASWQVTCNITKSKPKEAKYCVSFSAYYSESAIPCSTCACGCGNINTNKCSGSARPMLLPPDALLVPFDNQALKVKAWAKIKHYPIPARLPCPDNCGVSIKWHVNSDYRFRWTARMAIFNWDETVFEDWSVAVEL